MRGIGRIAQREFLRYWRRRGEALQPCLVFVLVCAMFPLGGVPDPALLARSAPAILWTAALLATVMGLEALFRQELAEGWVDALLLSPWPPALILLIKISVHWLFTGLPVSLLAWPLAHALYVPDEVCRVIVWSLLLGTPSLCFVGSIGAALTAALPRGGVLTGLLMLPLYVPILIFGAGIGVARYDGLPVVAQIQLLAALLLGALLLAPLATAAALKIAAD